MAKNKHIGSSLDDFLKEEGCLEEFTAAAIKEVFAWQIEQRMKDEGITKVVMARKMETSRSQLDRLLDPTDGNVTLATMQRAASVFGEVLSVGLVPKKQSKKWQMVRIGGKAPPKGPVTARKRVLRQPTKPTRQVTGAGAHKG